MHFPHARKLVGSGLAVMVLLAMGFVAPAVRHTHPGGHTPHTLWLGDGVAPSLPQSHGDGHLHAGHGKHSHAKHSHVHASGPRAAEKHDADRTPHQHLTWFWWEITLPASESPERGRPADRSPADEWSAGLGIRLATLLLPFPDQSCASTARLPSLPAALICEPTLADTVRAHACMRLGVPLCDTARHERSGTQLI
jgi:hypothetical protein